MELLFSIISNEIYIRYKEINFKLKTMKISLKKVEDLKKCFFKLTEIQKIWDKNMKLFLLFTLAKIFVKTLTYLVLIIVRKNLPLGMYGFSIMFIVEQFVRLASIVSCGKVTIEVSFCVFLPNVLRM
jgi:hypothetical protein